MPECLTAITHTLGKLMEISWCNRSLCQWRYLSRKEGGTISIIVPDNTAIYDCIHQMQVLVVGRLQLLGAGIWYSGCLSCFSIWDKERHTNHMFSDTTQRHTQETICVICHNLMILIVHAAARQSHTPHACSMTTFAERAHRDNMDETRHTKSLPWNEQSSISLIIN